MRMCLDSLSWEGGVWRQLPAVLFLDLEQGLCLVVCALRVAHVFVHVGVGPASAGVVVCRFQGDKAQPHVFRFIQLFIYFLFLLLLFSDNYVVKTKY